MLDQAEMKAHFGVGEYMATEQQLVRLSDERLSAYQDYHETAIALAHAYGRRSLKDEKALQDVRRVIRERDANRASRTPS